MAELDPDDLQTLTGVGPAIEKQLLELGVATVPELRAAVQQAAATTGSSPLQYLKQNLAAHPVREHAQESLRLLFGTNCLTPVDGTQRLHCRRRWQRFEMDSVSRRMQTCSQSL